MKYTYELSKLQERGATSLSLTYNTDQPDTAELSFKPEAYASFPWSYGDRIELFESGRKVFSGILAESPAYAAMAAQGEDFSIQLRSDIFILQNTAYARLNARGEAIYDNTAGEFVSVGAFARSVYNWASGWEGSLLQSSFVCELDGRIPVPQGHGTTSCGMLLQEAQQWTPDAVCIQRYAAEGDVLSMTTSAALEPLILSDTAPVQSISLQARPDLVPPVCALVGGAHMVLPEGGDIRELGSFIYPVPVNEKESGPGGRAGSSPASSKMVVRGVPVPDRYQFKRGVEEYQTSAIQTGSNTHKFLSHFYPQYTKFLQDCSAGACVISIVPPEDLAEDGQESNDDEDAQPTPANYQDNAEAWIISSPYVLTEGSFSASSNSKKNLKGLRWCKAKLTLSISLKKEDVKDTDAVEVMELFPGRRKNAEDKTVFYATLTVEGVLINRRRRVYDPATNRPCSSDPEYSEEEDEAEVPTAAEYRAALQNYFNSSRTVYTNGSITVLHTGELCPEALTGRAITVQGRRAEWETMNAVVRSVTWDYARRKLNLSVGSRATLGYGEQVERLMLNRLVGLNKARRLAIPADVADASNVAEAEADMTVAPSVSATVGSVASGRWHKPWTLYPKVESVNEDGSFEVVWWLAGGTLNRGKLYWNVPDTDKQIVAGEPGPNGWTHDGGEVRIKFYRDARGAITYDIYQK